MVDAVIQGDEEGKKKQLENDSGKVVPRADAPRKEW
jgi:hypothetical protein